MAANITVTRVKRDEGPELRRSRRMTELVKLQGATTAVDDTGTYNVETFKPNSSTFIIGGGFDITGVSGQQVTIRSKIALGNAANYVEIAEAI